WQATIASATSLADGLLRSLDAALGPHPHDALGILTRALEASKPYIRSASSMPFPLGNTFYRVRIAGGKQLQLGDLFHIPFEQRHKVARQRYSHPGVPCLYLGQSLYCCWKEMAEPDLNRIVVSRFRLSPNANLTLLDLGWRPSWIGELVREHESKVSAWALS